MSSSAASEDSAGANSWPWARVRPIERSSRSCCSVSTFAAVIGSPSERPMPTIASNSRTSREPSASSVRNEASTFSASNGSARTAASDE